MDAQNTASFRCKGKEVLSAYSALPKNIALLERSIYKLAPAEEGYLEILYQVSHMFSRGQKIKEVMSELRAGRFGYDHRAYDDCRKKQEEYDEYLDNPFQVEQGIMRCVKCRSERTMSYLRQDRAADEGTSVYSQCLDCKHKWRENN